MFAFVMLMVVAMPAHAAWPDIYPSRIAALNALRYDLVMPEIRRDESMVAAQYAAACQKGFPGTCQTDWAGDLTAAASAFRRTCSHEPLSCTVMGWDLSRVNGELSNYATNPSRAVQIFETSCKTDLYAPACTSLGELYQFGVGVSPSAQQAHDLYTEGCEARDLWGCYRLGAMLHAGSDIPRDAQRAAELLQSACDNHIIQACAILGDLRQSGDGVERDFVQAAAYHTLGCEAGLTDNCYALGQLYAQGRGVVHSGLTALGLYRTVCSSGDLRGCYGEGVMYAEGEGVPQNLDVAVQKFDRTCEAGFAQGCSRLGMIYFHGQGLRKDRPLGLRYLRRGCNAGDPLGCEELGAALIEGGREITPDPEQAVRVLHLSCEGGSGRACGLMADLYVQGSIPSGDRSPQMLHSRACELQYGESCRWLAERESAPEASVAWYQKGCAADDGKSCGHTGRAALAEEDSAAAAHWLQQACLLNDIASCTQAGQLHQAQGDLITALAMYERGCEQGRADACQAAAPITFEARFNEVLLSAFSSSVCQIWRIDDTNPTDSALLVDVDGPVFWVHAGTHAGTEATAWHLDERIEQGATWYGRSRWSVGGGDSEENLWLNSTTSGPPVWPPPAPTQANVATAWQRQDRYWEEAMVLVERWDTQDSIENFPSEFSYTQHPDNDHALSYSRTDGTIRHLRAEQCSFVGNVDVLQSEHCSEVQALLAASLLEACN